MRKQRVQEIIDDPKFDANGPTKQKTKKTIKTI